ncbi:MAG: ribosomal RNA small subunit methyltransferase A [Elusimicrobia bacterium RIFOXYA2_FULL_39_19]|nr:MAG: ribosomal RNA small subunit methyltransferase A [Elusimicrobia bacterium RIFOXYA2_FULL_39_19]
MHKPKFSQHYLIDKTVAENVVKGGSFTPEDTVIEIGPGKGVLTALIAPQVNKLVCLEIDTYLTRRLQEKFKDQTNIEIIETDFLDWPIRNFKSQISNLKFISNLPYSVTSPIIRKALSNKSWTTAVFMMQKEVGERILSGPGSRDYGFLSICTQFYSVPEKLFNVSSSCFDPVPDVESIVLKFTRKKISVKDRAIAGKMFELVKAAFSQRRKTIINPLSDALNFPKTELTQILHKAGIDPSLRPEAVSLVQFLELTRLLANKS